MIANLTRGAKTASLPLPAPAENFFQNPLTDGELYDRITVPLSGGFFCVPFWDKAHALDIEGGIQRERSRILSGGADIMRVKITLACTECKQRNYDTEKNKKNDPDRLELNKYCRFCRKHTLHKETK